MICIDFQGGTHGNFLEFVCNVAADVLVEGMPFNNLGAAHNKKYISDKIFFADHYSTSEIALTSDCIISIRIEPNDLLPLTQISLLRAGDHEFDNNKLEINTYNKLNNKHHRWVLDNIIESFFTNQIKNSYDNVKDPSWPDVNTVSEFQSLPGEIRDECINVHQLKLFELNEEYPDCHRDILREFFQIGFEYPLNHGFMTQQKRLLYGNNTKVYNFPFSAFYTPEFLDQIEEIALWAGFRYTKKNQVKELHEEFLLRQPYKDSKIICDNYVKQLIDRPDILPPEVNLIEESYINAMLKKSGYECRY